MGSSHGSTRIIREAYYEHPLYVPLLQRAYELWDELSQVSGTPLFQRTGGLTLGPRDGHLVAGTMASLQEHGLTHRILTPAEVVAEWPGFAIPEDFIGIWERRAGILFPERAIATHLREAELAGAHIQLDTQLLNWNQRGEQVVVETDRGIIACRKLVLALGAWIGKHAGSVSLRFKAQRQTVHWFNPVHPPMTVNYPVFLLEHEPNGLIYSIPDTGEGIKVGIHYGGPVVDPDTVSRTTTPGEEAAVRHELARFFPAANGPLRASSVCLYTNTPDLHFVVDWLPENADILLLSPCSGHGFKFASVMGEIAADLLIEGSTRFNLAPFSLQRFQAS
jgi:sarcosine oxidase